MKKLLIQWRYNDIKNSWRDSPMEIDSVDYGRVLLERWSKNPHREYRLIERETITTDKVIV